MERTKQEKWRRRAVKSQCSRRRGLLKASWRSFERRHLRLLTRTPHLSCSLMVKGNYMNIDDGHRKAVHAEDHKRNTKHPDGDRLTVDPQDFRVDRGSRPSGRFSLGGASWPSYQVSPVRKRVVICTFSAIILASCLADFLACGVVPCRHSRQSGQRVFILCSLIGTFQCEFKCSIYLLEVQACVWPQEL